MRFISDITVELVQSCGDDAMLAAAARVSTKGAEARPQEDNEGLINYLMKNRHGTPFEHAFMTFFVHAPIFVYREWHRHRIGVSINEESGRYKELEPVFYTPAKDRGGEMQVPGGRPGQYTYEDADNIQQIGIDAALVDTCRRAYHNYQVLLEQGVAKEVARMALPLNIYSSMYWSCNPRSLMAFLSLRTRREPWDWEYTDHGNAEAGAAKFPSKPQREINMPADKLEAIFAELFPSTHRAFCLNGRVAP